MKGRCESCLLYTSKERFHKKEGVQGYHLVQSFAEGEVCPELAHLIGQELAEQLLKGQYEVVITTHLNTSHYHNHLDVYKRQVQPCFIRIMWSFPGRTGNWQRI